MPSNNNATNVEQGGLSSLHYPRTGKRGVPQQFPRRLYEMLQSESKLIAASADHPRIIFWSESGKAFRIADVTEFSSTILPKYFRTKKFSSFQRNLNLYGFAKVRRGPETDMYAHPSFVRDQADSLSKLRKLTSSSSRRRGPTAKLPKTTTVSRSVSPSPTLMLANAQYQAPPLAQIAIPTSVLVKPTPSYVAPPKPTPVPTPPAVYGSPKHTAMWAPIHQVPPSPEASAAAPPAPVQNAPETPLLKPSPVGRGKLDLLALAMEQATAMQQ